MVSEISLNGARWVLGIADDWDDIDDRPTVEVRVPEFDKPNRPPAYVFLRAMSEVEKETFQLKRIENDHIEPDLELARERDRQKTYGEVLRGLKVDLLVHCIVNERGDRYLRDGDVTRLEQRNPVVIDRLYKRAREINGLDEAKPEPENPSTAGPSSPASSD